MTEPLIASVLDHQLKALRLPALRREYGSVAREARQEGWAYEDYLRVLLDLEITERHQRAVATRVKAARFPAIKSLDQLDFSCLKGVNRPQLLHLATGAFIEQATDIVVAGPVGTGKTHIALGLGLEAARRRFHVLFVRASDLVRELTEARDERQLGRYQRRLERVQLLIVDELGFVPFERAGGELLFNLLSERHGKASTIVTTNLAFGEWVQVFGSEKLTTALLDRLCANSEILVTQGQSYRTRGRLDGAMVKQRKHPPDGSREERKETETSLNR